ncbi:MAG: hypothetical protein AAB436_00375 [Patescibacteria group bacterium]
MSEKASFKPEVQETLAALPEHAEPPKKGNHEVTKLNVNEARADVSETVQAETQLNPIEALNAAEKASAPVTPTILSRELKKVTQQRGIYSIQRKLPPAKRALSKVIHQPIVRVVSEAASKTVSRPSGLLGGGIVAFLGTSSYLYLARHVGFTYNYFVVILLMIGGFALGVILELLVNLATASRHSRNNS